MLNFMAFYWPPGSKKDTTGFGSQFATLGANVRAFISNFGPNNKPKMLKVGPQVFPALTPTVKGP